MFMIHEQSSIVNKRPLMREQLLQEATAKLPRLEGLHLDVEFLEEGGEDGVDAYLHLEYFGVERTFHVRCRNSLTTTGISVLRSSLTEEQANSLVVHAPFINPTCAGRLRENGICFLDDEGHVFLHAEGLYLFVSGPEGSRKRVPPQEVPRGISRARPFKSTTLKFIYAALTDPQLDAPDPAGALLNSTYRVMSARTGLSLGSISGLLEDLAAGEFLIEVEGGNRILVNRRKLLERWVQDYGMKLRPKLVQGHYHPPRSAWWQEAEIAPWGGRWGGEIAGSKLTGYLKPEVATIYAPSVPPEFIVEQDLRKDPVGTVEIITPFWPEEPSHPFDDCVHPLIAYADLALSSIDRNLETADRIYDQHLRPIVESAG